MERMGFIGQGGVMAAAKKPVKRSINLRRQRRSTVTKFHEDDTLTAEWDHREQSWKLLIESANGLQIHHERLTLPKESR